MNFILPLFVYQLPITHVSKEYYETGKHCNKINKRSAKRLKEKYLILTPVIKKDLSSCLVV